MYSQANRDKSVIMLSISYNQQDKEGWWYVIHYVEKDSKRPFPPPPPSWLQALWRKKEQTSARNKYVERFLSAPPPHIFIFGQTHQEHSFLFVVYVWRCALKSISLCSLSEELMTGEIRKGLKLCKLPVIISQSQPFISANTDRWGADW